MGALSALKLSSKSALLFEIIFKKNTMQEKTYYQFETLDIFNNEIEIEKMTLSSYNFFSNNSPNISICHSETIHHGYPNSKNFVGLIYLIFKHENKNINEVLCLHLKCNVKDDDTSEAKLVYNIIKYAHSLLKYKILEQEIKDKNGNIFSIPDFDLPENFFLYAFPD